MQHNMIIYKTEHLQVVYKQDRFHRDFYELNFFGVITNIYTDFKGICGYIEKRQSALDLIPKGCIVIPAHLVKNFYGKLIGGVLEDSISIVYGICVAKMSNHGLSGYSCSVFFLPSPELMKELTWVENPFGVEGVFVKESEAKSRDRRSHLLKAREEEIYKRLLEYEQKGKDCLMDTEEARKNVERY